jgi:hypothetical protein
MSCYLIGGVSYNATLNLSSSYYSSQSAQVWIDFNDDGAFQSSETAGGITYPSTPNPVVTLAIPSGVAPGARRMRIVGNYVCCGYSIYPYINPCPSSAASYAFARDYGVNLTAGSPYGVISPASISFSPTSASTTSTAMVGVFNGTYLTPASGNLTVTASSDFSVCSTSAGTYASSYTLAYTGAAVSANNIYVKFNAPATAGYYTGTVCVSGGGLSAPVCSSLSGSSVISLGMPAMQETDFQVYPNPATTELYITTGGGNGAGISITNSVGTQAMRQPISAGETRLNIKGLPAGVYYIRLTGTGSSMVKRFVKL